MFNQDTKKSFLFSIGLLVIIWVIVGSFSWDINVKKRKTSELMANIAIQSGRKTEIKSLAQKLTNLDDKIEKIDTFILSPGQEVLVEFIEEIESIGKTAQVELVINSIEVMSPALPVLKDYEELNLTLEATGSFTQVFHFASLIENLPYHVDIKQVNLNGTLEGEEKKEISVWRGDFVFKVLKSKIVSREDKPEV